MNRYTRQKAEGEREAGIELMKALLVHDMHHDRGLRASYYRLSAFHQHKWIYDAASLQVLFESVGLASVQQKGYLDSAIVGIEAVEDSARIENGEGVAIEGIKP